MVNLHAKWKNSVQRRNVTNEFEGNLKEISHARNLLITNFVYRLINRTTQIKSSNDPTPFVFPFQKLFLNVFLSGVGSEFCQKQM